MGTTSHKWVLLAAILVVLTAHVRAGHFHDEDCICHGQCKPQMDIRSTTKAVCPTCMCHPCPTCAPCHHEQNVTCEIPGYEEVELGGGSRCLKVSDKPSVAAEAECERGGLLYRADNASDIVIVQEWAWDKLGTKHAALWTSGVGDEGSGGYNWRQLPLPAIDLSAYDWHNGSPPGTTSCLNLSPIEGKLGYGSCSELALFFICSVE